LQRSAKRVGDFWVASGEVTTKKKRGGGGGGGSPARGGRTKNTFPVKANGPHLKKGRKENLSEGVRKRLRA